ncbi:MAG: ribosome biogenesis GTPase YlqF, partial [Hydrogenophaga sp.]|nr:ribosome biogenesis GTPase YlqF [Hydrogenophaga sp.]
TPGMLWPRIVVPESGFNLAASGAVGRNAYDDQEVALELLAKLKVAYPALLEGRYKLGLALEAVAAMPDEDLLEAIARKRGALAAGGHANWQKAAELLIADYRSHSIGRITLETPEMFGQWLAAGHKADAERQNRKKERGNKPSKPRKR